MPILSRLTWMGFGRETTSPTLGGTINQTPATVTVPTGFTGSFPANGGYFVIQVGAVTTSVFFTSTTATTFVGCTVTTGSVVYTTASLIYVQGVIAAPTLYIPVQQFTPEDLPNYVRDESLVGNPTVLRGAYQAEFDSKVDFDGLLYPELVGPFLVSLGFLDTITGAGPTYTHTFKIPASGLQPPSFTVHDFDGFEQRAYPGQVLDSLNIKVDAKGGVKYTAKAKGWKSSATTLATPSFPSSPSFLGWQGATTIAGFATSRFMLADITIQRATSPIHTLSGTQSPSVVWAGGVDVMVKFASLFENNQELNYLLNNPQPAGTIVLTVPGGGTAPVLTISMQKINVKKGALNRGQQYIQLDSDADLVYNTTDGSAASFILVNGVSTAYT